jgi:hypothetical protein
MGTTTTTKVSICLILFAVAFRGLINAKDECLGFEIIEATIEDLQNAFRQTELTSRKLVDFYLNRIELLNPILRAVLEVNPDALDQADKADRERREDRNRSLLHGIPVCLRIVLLPLINSTLRQGRMLWLGQRFHVMRTWFLSLGMLVLLFWEKLVFQSGMGFVLILCQKLGAPEVDLHWILMWSLKVHAGLALDLPFQWQQIWSQFLWGQKLMDPLSVQQIITQ